MGNPQSKQVPASCIITTTFGAIALGPDHAPATTLRTAATKSSPLAARDVNGRKMLQPFLRRSTRKQRAAAADTIRAGILEGRTTAEMVRDLIGTRAKP